MHARNSGREGAASMVVGVVHAAMILQCSGTRRCVILSNNLSHAWWSSMHAHTHVLRAAGTCSVLLCHCFVPCDVLQGLLSCLIAESFNQTIICLLNKLTRHLHADQASMSRVKAGHPLSRYSVDYQH